MSSAAIIQNYSVEELLDRKEIDRIIVENYGENKWAYVRGEVKRAGDGQAGFLGDHFRVALVVKVGENFEEIRLFIKCLPLENKPKADFISQGGYFTREAVSLKLFEEIGGADGPNTWCTKTYICNERIIVMPDLAIQGYTILPQENAFDLAHNIIALTSLARFHATFANHETRKSSQLQRPYNFLQDFSHVMTELTFQDSPWLRAAAKLTANFLNAFSNKWGNKIGQLETKLTDLFIECCNTLRMYEDTLNVLIHRDLWANNVMFRYENGIPQNALLIDFQCIRYTPPAFDVMTFLHLVTSRQFRSLNEKDLLKHYFATFTECLDQPTKERVRGLNYDYDSFLGWCERSRFFGLFEAVVIMPYTLMDPVNAANIFNQPETYDKYTYEDRTEPVVRYSREHANFKCRLLEASEEFVERYLLNVV